MCRVRKGPATLRCSARASWPAYQFDREFGSRDKSGIQFVGIPSRLNAQLGQLGAKTELDSTALCAEAKRGGPANP